MRNFALLDVDFDGLLSVDILSVHEEVVLLIIPMISEHLDCALIQLLEQLNRELLVKVQIGAYLLNLALLYLDASSHQLEFKLYDKYFLVLGVGF